MRVARRFRPMRLGRNPNRLATARTFAEVVFCTAPLALSARDTVATETPAAAATSLMVGALPRAVSPDGLGFGMPECNRCENVYIIGTLRDTAVTSATVFGNLQMEDRDLTQSRSRIWPVEVSPLHLYPRCQVSFTHYVEIWRRSAVCRHLEKRSIQVARKHWLADHPIGQATHPQAQRVPQLRCVLSRADHLGVRSDVPLSLVGLLGTQFCAATRAEPFQLVALDQARVSESKVAVDSSTTPTLAETAKPGARLPFARPEK